VPDRSSVPGSAASDQTARGSRRRFARRDKGPRNPCFAYGRRLTEKLDDPAGNRRRRIDETHRPGGDMSHARGQEWIVRAGHPKASMARDIRVAYARESAAWWFLRAGATGC
jgi:hypothetical protein